MGIEDRLTIRRAILDPGHYLRRQYVLTYDYGPDEPVKRMEPLGDWSSRAVLAALGVIPRDVPTGPPVEVEAPEGWV